MTGALIAAAALILISAFAYYRLSGDADAGEPEVGAGGTDDTRSVEQNQ